MVKHSVCIIRALPNVQTKYFKIIIPLKSIRLKSIRFYQKILILSLVCALGLVGCKESKSEAIAAPKVSFKKEGELEIIKSDSTKINLDIEIADNDYEDPNRFTFMYRQSMGEGQGMLFVLKEEKIQSFYMKNTEFALDIIYINSDLKIVSFQKNAQPLSEKSLPSSAAAKYVLEINAGLSDKWGLSVGDSIAYVRK